MIGNRKTKFRLGDLVTLKRGYDLPESMRTAGNYPIVSSSGITGSHNEYKVEGPGVVTGRYGTLGEVFYVPNRFWPLNTSLYVVSFKGNNPRFVSYYLRTVLSANFNAAGAVPGVNRNVLHKLVIPGPPSEPLKVAAILSAYDDMIENNRRRITLLEKMAKEIYREWFVRMRFPGHKKVRIQKRVPEGWEWDFASKFFGHVKGKSYAGNELTDKPEDMPFITLKSFNRGGGYRANGLKHYSGKYKDGQVVYQGDVVMAVTDMTQNREVVGRVARIPEIGEKGAAISLDVIKLIPKTISASFLYSYMLLSGFGEFIKEFANGTNVLHLKPELVTRQKIIMLPKELREIFVAIVDPIYDQIDSLSEGIVSLIASRDMLLPRLISGKLRVENLDIQFPPSMLNEAGGQGPEAAHA